MSHRILVTGASGYLGGTLLARFKDADLPPYEKFYALVRNDLQAEADVQYGAEPLRLDLEDEVDVRNGLVDNQINIVYFLVDAFRADAQVHFIKRLAEVKEATGQEVHFLHTSGAKTLSSHSAAPTDRPLLDTDPDLYSIQKSQIENVSFDIFKKPVTTNCTMVEEAARGGVRSYQHLHTLRRVWEGRGFWQYDFDSDSRHRQSRSKAAQALKKVYKVDEGRPTWPVCHIIDNTTLYLQILRTIMNGEDPGHGKDGDFLASSGSVAWDDLYTAVATAMAKRNAVDDDSVVPASKAILEQMGEALGCPPEYVTVQFGGQCKFTAEHGKKIGWKPRYAPEHILEDADAEVELILNNS